MTTETEKLFRDDKSLKNWVFAWAADVKGIPLDSEINDLIWVIEKHTRATPQPIGAWLPIETYDYEKSPQVILAGFITPSEYAQSNGSKPFWEISIGRCWHVNTRKFTGFLGQQPTHWMPLPKPPEDR